MTTQLQLLEAVRGHGIRTKFAATGQTGILIEGSWRRHRCGHRRLHRRCCREARARLREGGGPGARGRPGLDHSPELLGRDAYGLMHGSLPHAQVMCAQPTRTAINRCEWVKIPPLVEFIKMSEAATKVLRPAPVIAVALNTYDLSDDEARRVVEQVARAKQDCRRRIRCASAQSRWPVRSRSSIAIASIAELRLESGNYGKLTTRTDADDCGKLPDLHPRQGRVPIARLDFDSTAASSFGRGGSLRE